LGRRFTVGVTTSERIAQYSLQGRHASAVLVGWRCARVPSDAATYAHGGLQLVYASFPLDESDSPSFDTWRDVLSANITSNPLAIHTNVMLAEKALQNCHARFDSCPEVLGYDDSKAKVKPEYVRAPPSPSSSTLRTELERDRTSSALGDPKFLGLCASSTRKATESVMWELLHCLSRRSFPTERWAHSG
jgi:hypothetical protein